MKKKVKAFFKKNPGRGIKPKTLAKKLNISAEHEYIALKAFLHQLVEENYLVRQGKRYKLAGVPTANVVTGELEINPGGYGFVSLKNSKLGDIFIAARNLNTAFNGDKVEVSLFAQQSGKNIEGQVINVIERKRKEIVGTLKKSKAFYFVVPDEPEIHRDIYIDKDDLKGAKKGDKVIVGNINWDSSMHNPEGDVIEVLGRAGSPDTEVASIAREFNLPYIFPPKVTDEASGIELKITDEELKNRKDFRDKNVFTIDPEDAKDFDDALSVEETKDGNFSIGIHIADVSHYVKRNSELDKEALKRGNSVYLVGHVIPMLPEKLSNGICSLVPNEDRLTFSVLVNLTARGKVLDYKIEKTVINSKRRFTYEEAQEVIEKQEGDYSTEIILLNKLASTLRKKRLREGSIDFVTPEVKFELDDEGNPVGIEKKEIKESNMLVEEFMLLANRIIAKHIAAPGKRVQKPFIYRVHDLPDREKLIEFARFVKSLGYSFDPNTPMQSKQFQLLLSQVKGEEEESLINELAIRSMAKAVYDKNNIGHYGLGFKFYTHFTSPIRRYADLMVHRLLEEYKTNRKKTSFSFSQVEEIANHISETERNAVEAERLSVKIKQVEYLREHIGQEFSAIISGVTHFGMFVKVTEILAEGLIRVRDLEGDFYVYDEKKYSLIGRSSGKRYRLGDRVRVQLVRIDMEKLELDFIICET